MQNEEGSLNVVGGGSPDAMSILNQTTTEFVCGLAAARQFDTPSSIVAMPLFANMLDAINPLEKVLLMFTSSPLRPGEVIVRAFAQGLLVDMTDAMERSVSFDISTGWSAGGAAWAQIVDPNTLLGPLLVQLVPLG